MTAGEIVGNWAVFFILTTCPLYTGFLLSCRLFKKPPFSVRCISTAFLSIAIIILIFLALANLHLFYKFMASLVCFIPALIAHLLWRKHQDFAAGIKAVKGFYAWTKRKKVWPFLLAAILIIVLTIFRGLFMPPMAWDSYTYHLVLPAKWIQEHSQVDFSAPHGIDGYSHFPINGQILTAWVLLPWHNDFLANLVNYPFLIMGALILYALGRGFKLSRKFNLLLAGLVLFSPMLFAYITTAYVDIQVFVYLVGALLFLCRVLDKYKNEDALLFFLSIALAVGTKQTSFYLSILMLIFFVFAWLKKHGKAEVRPAIILISIGFLTMIMIGGHQYLKNWATVKNPLYPYTVSPAGQKLFEGSLYVKKIVQDKGLGDSSHDVKNLKILFSYTRSVFPRSAGPKFLLFLVLAAGSFLYFLPPQKNKKIGMLWLFAFAPLIFFYLDSSTNTILSRRFWPLDSSRFLAPSLAIICVLSLIVLSRLEKHLPRISFFLFLFIAADWTQVNYRLLSPGQNIFLMIFTLMAFVIPAFLVFKLIKKNQLIRRGITGGVIFLSLIGISHFLLQYRETTRWDYFTDYIDLHSFPRDYVKGWIWCDQPDRSLSIALAAGWSNSGHNWFYYPLMGSHWQNHVAYASIDRKGIYSTLDSRGMRGSNADFSSWLYNLQMLGIDLVFIQSPWPVELGWAQKHPQYFKKELQGDSFYIYRFHHPKESKPLAY